MDQLDIDWTLRHQDDICNGKSATYYGIPIKKNPLDLWIYQEIIHERKPEVIVEVGSWMGASALFLADCQSRAGDGDVIACDISPRPDACAPWAVDGIIWIQGDIAEASTLHTIRDEIGDKTCMVIHDAEHDAEPVLRDLRNLAPLVTVGQYLIVEDGIIDVWGAKPGPMHAIDTFLDTSKDFRADFARERYGITWNPCGYLERVR